MRGIRLVVGLALLVTACDAGVEERATTVCTTLCKCQAPPIAMQQQACIDDCVPEFIQVADQLTEECLSCIEGHTNRCATVEVDCEPVCNIDEPPPPEPPVRVDAGV